MLEKIDRKSCLEGGHSKLVLFFGFLNLNFLVLGLVLLGFSWLDLTCLTFKLLTKNDGRKKAFFLI